MKINCIIVDDEPGALMLLAHYISKTPSVELLGNFSSGAKALAFLQDRSVDVVLTDIDMPGMTGLELADALPAGQQIIFITGSEQYALEVFRYRVIDYMLKPLSYERFSRAISKIQAGNAVRTESNAAVSDHLFAKKNGGMVRIDFDDILYVKGEKEYISLHFRQERVLIYKRMKEMENFLPSNFIRVHSSYIINTDHLLKVHAGKTVIVGSQKIPIGGTYRTRFVEFLSRDLF